MTREKWLNECADRLRQLFAENGVNLPERIRISCGWPLRGGTSPRKRTIGQCFNPKCSKDETTEIFISPWLGDPLVVAETLLHEMVHAAVGTECGHKDEFVDVAGKLGLLRPWTAPTASPELKQLLASILPEGYTHAELNPAMQLKKQAARMIKVECGECGYTLRTTRKWLDDRGTPICPCNKEAMREPDVPTPPAEPISVGGE